MSNPQNTQNKRDKAVTREIHRLFWRANLQDKPNLILTYVGRIPAFAIYNTIMPLIAAYGIQAILEHRMHDVQRYAVIMILLGLLYTVLVTIGESAICKNAIVGCKYLQRVVFSNYLSKDYEFYSSSYFGAVGAKVGALRDALNGYGELVTIAVPKQATIIITAVVIIGLQSLALAIITVLTMVVVLGFTIVSSRYRIKFRRAVSEASSVLAGEVGDALTHGSTVKSFARETYEQQHLEKSLKVWADAQYRSWISAFPADIGRTLLVTVSTATLLLASADYYEQGKITVTIVVLIQLYVVKLVTSTLDIAEMIKRYEMVMGAAYDPVRTMLLPTSINDPLEPKSLPRAKTEQFEVSLQAVSYHYDEAAAGQHAIKDFDLTIKPGEKVGLVGYSGSGKTTLTKLLLRFMDVTKGGIRLNGIDIRELKQSDLRSIISYVPQEPLLFHRSIGENIAYGNPAAKPEAIAEAAKLAYVDDFVAELPNGYDTFVGERGVKLSGGQRQRVAIARALLKDAPILVLDEATSALDSQSEQYIQKALWELMKDRTALVIAHRLSTIQRMDRIIVMDKGKVVQQGTHEALLRDKTGIYAKLWAHQSGGYLPKSQDG